MTDYTSVWAEPQNVDVVKEARADLRDGETVQIVLQPGDCTRYVFSLTPIYGTSAYEFSDDGRLPAVPMSVNRPDGLIVVILNEGFADRAGFVWGEDWLDGLEDRMGIRNPCTTDALIETIRAVWL